jgi:hypothetical protein
LRRSARVGTDGGDPPDPGRLTRKGRHPERRRHVSCRGGPGGGTMALALSSVGGRREYVPHAKRGWPGLREDAGLHRVDLQRARGYPDPHQPARPHAPLRLRWIVRSLNARPTVAGLVGSVRPYGVSPRKARQASTVASVSSSTALRIRPSFVRVDSSREALKARGESFPGPSFGWARPSWVPTS